MVNKFYDLLEQSVIIQGVLTLMVVGVWLYITASGQSPNQMLDSIVGLVVGFYFGQKSVRQAVRLAKQINPPKEE